MAVKKKTEVNWELKYAEQVAALNRKVRKLQKENRELRAKLAKEISTHMPDVNELLVAVEETEVTETTTEKEN